MCISGVTDLYVKHKNITITETALFGNYYFISCLLDFRFDLDEQND